MEEKVPQGQVSEYKKIGFTYQNSHLIPGSEGKTRVRVQEYPDDPTKIIAMDESSLVQSTYVIKFSPPQPYRTAQPQSEKGEIEYYYCYCWHIVSQGISLSIGDRMENYCLQLWGIEKMIKPKKNPTFSLHIYLENDEIRCQDYMRGERRAFSDRKQAIEYIDDLSDYLLDDGVIGGLLDLMKDPWSEKAEMTIGNMVFKGYREYDARLRTKKD